MYFSDHGDSNDKERRNHKRYEINMGIDENGVVDAASVTGSGVIRGFSIKGKLDIDNGLISYKITSMRRDICWVQGKFDKKNKTIIGKWYSDKFGLVEEGLVILIDKNQRISTREFLNSKWKIAANFNKQRRIKKREIDMVMEPHNDDGNLLYYINDPREHLENEKEASTEEKAKANVILAEVNIDGVTRVFGVTDKIISRGQHLFANFHSDYGFYVKKLSQVKEHKDKINNILDKNNVGINFR